MKTSMLAAGVFLVLAGCAGPGGRASNTAEAPLLISPQVWAYFQAYTRERQPMAFAVSADGNHAGYSYCPEMRCFNQFASAGPLALGSCTTNGGKDCRIFASGTRIRVAYQVRPL